MRTGLADPALARYSTWDELAARLVDAQVGSLANRVRRLAGLVGTSPGWHDALLAELGMLHLLAQAGRRVAELPAELGDGVAVAVGWQVRHAAVLAGVPDTDRWHVIGRSDRREDRIEVRRSWLRGERSGRLAMVLSFAAYQQSLDSSLPVGSAVHADVHRFPGSGMRSLVGLAARARRSGTRATGRHARRMRRLHRAGRARRAVDRTRRRHRARRAHRVGRSMGAHRRDRQHRLRRQRPGLRGGARRHRRPAGDDHGRMDARGTAPAHRAPARSPPRRRTARRPVVRECRMSSWDLLVTTALLGTDRRQPPPPPAGPIADTVSDLAVVHGDQSPDRRLLNQVAVTTLARRAASRPAPPVELLGSPPPDPRPLCPPAAVGAWRRAVAEWPVLEDEWLSLAWRYGVSLPGDVLVELLERHRHDANRTAVVSAVAGDVVPWLRDHLPSIGRSHPKPPVVDPTALPELPIGPLLEPLRRRRPERRSRRTLAARLASGELDAVHRPVLVNLLARCRTIVLDDTIDALSPLADTNGVAASLVDLGRLPAAMISSFAGAPDQ